MARPKLAVGHKGISKAFRCALKKASDYKEHAKECRALARTAVSPEHKAMLEKMAQTWESLARDRLERLARTHRISQLEQAVDSEQGANP